MVPRTNNRERKRNHYPSAVKMRTRGAGTLRGLPARRVKGPRSFMRAGSPHSSRKAFFATPDPSCDGLAGPAMRDSDEFRMFFP